MALISLLMSDHSTGRFHKALRFTLWVVSTAVVICVATTHSLFLAIKNDLDLRTTSALCEIEPLVNNLIILLKKICGSSTKKKNSCRPGEMRPAKKLSVLLCVFVSPVSRVCLRWRQAPIYRQVAVSPTIQWRNTKTENKTEWKWFLCPGGASWIYF